MNLKNIVLITNFFAGRGFLNFFADPRLAAPPCLLIQQTKTGRIFIFTIWLFWKCFRAIFYPLVKIRQVVWSCAHEGRISGWMTMTKGLDEASTKFFDSLMLHSHGIKLGDKTTRQIKIYFKKNILHASPPVLRDITFRPPSGQLTMVVGMECGYNPGTKKGEI